MNLTKNVENAVREYQCSGCINGDAITCYVQQEDGVGCNKHLAGTYVSFMGKILLGLPKGFNRMGETDMNLYIFETLKKGIQTHTFDKWNIPVWKHVNENGHTLVRGILPRINEPFLRIYLEDCAKDIDCLEITNVDIEGMD